MNAARRAPTWYLWVPLVVILLVVGVWLVGSNRAAQEGPATPSAAGSTTSSSVATSPRASASRTPESGLPTVAESALPRQAKATLALIRAGGPYPHQQDDGIFGNRERVLPKRANGYYREYTVITPGENDRGPRRIVAGHDGDLYWTTDHYASFRQVLEGQ